LSSITRTHFGVIRELVLVFEPTVVDLIHARAVTFGVAVQHRDDTLVDEC
jgi:hypothetical protein